ncbi:hypothetical protein UFOVP607_54 [uncultured Caudovirales phage]|uniref:Uncharacterized protein n=1 Tax=uncultured Caudovirales phage TaxID=2100421 RepID=A0A6J5N729_9CAUD|nr:hypothetical protein UFOVP607_54 [uncultured Caudovirales phage]
MSHFAKLNVSNIVTEVITADQSFIDALPDAGLWVQTSYTARIRGKYAGIGDTYDKDRDMFVAPYVDPIVQSMNVSAASIDTTKPI